MPGKKLDKKNLEQYKKLLLKTKEDVTEDLRNISTEGNGSGDDTSRDISGHALHMADVATDMYDREFNLGLASNDRELLYKVNMALARIADGSYGICAECKKPIPAKRLKAIPYAETCRQCQEDIESRR